MYQSDKIHLKELKLLLHAHATEKEPKTHATPNKRRKRRLATTAHVVQCRTAVGRSRTSIRCRWRGAVKQAKVGGAVANNLKVASQPAVANHAGGVATHEHRPSGFKHVVVVQNVLVRVTWDCSFVDSNLHKSQHQTERDTTVNTWNVSCSTSKQKTNLAIVLALRLEQPGQFEQPVRDRIKLCLTNDILQLWVCDGYGIH